MSKLQFLLLILPIASIFALSGCSSSSEVFSCPSCEGGDPVTNCGSCDGYLFVDRQKGTCYARQLFGEDFLWMEIVASFFWPALAGIATACGVGGGGIFVPLGILLLRFPPKASSGLSQASIFGASVGGLIVNIHKRHPTAGKQAALVGGGDSFSRPLIDYDMALFFAPMQMAGAIIGVIIQTLFPDWLFVSFAVVVLGFVAYKTYQKFLQTYRKEKEARKLDAGALVVGENVTSDPADNGMNAHMNGIESEFKEDGSNRDDLNQKLNGVDAEDLSSRDCTMDMADTSRDTIEDPIKSEKLMQFLKEDSRQYPAEKLGYLILLGIVLSVMTFLKGGSGVNSVIGVTCEDAGYYIVLAAQFIWLLGFAAVFGYRLLKRTQSRVEVGYPFLESDVSWDIKMVRFYFLCTFLAGVVAGLIGIGGGMVLAPLMLVMGVEPSVCSATNAALIILTSSSVAVMFVMSGLLPWEYALYFFCICLLGASFGKMKVDSFIKRTGMSSVIIGGLAAIIALSTAGCLVILFMNLAKNDWCLESFKPFCVVKLSEDECPSGRFLLSEAQDLFPY